MVEQLVTAEEIKNVYEGLRHDMRLYFNAKEQMLLMDTKLKKEIARALLEKEIEGKNIAERDAAANKRYAFPLAVLSTFETEERYRKAMLDEARIDVEEMRALLRLAELEAHIGKEKID